MINVLFRNTVGYQATENLAKNGLSRQGFIYLTIIKTQEKN